MNQTNTKQIDTLEGARAEISRLRRLLRRREQDNRMLSVMNDHAEQLRRLNEREKNLQLLYNEMLLENCPNMLLLFNRQHRLVLCSLASLPLLAGPNRAQLVNQPIRQVFGHRLDPAFVEKLAAEVEQVTAASVTIAYAATLCLGEDRLLHAQVEVVPVIDAEGAVQGSLVNINDITELSEAKKQAEEASRSKSSFLANMSHEIRTPMNAIKGLAELMALTGLSELQRNYLENIIASAGSLINIINDILDFSKIDAQKIELLDGPWNVGDLLSEVSNVAAMRIGGKDLALLIQADPAMPRELWGDDVRVKQVVVNILTNAVKYTHQGFVWLRLSTAPGQDGRLRLCCSIQDTGIGIKEEELPTLFQAFSRADLAANRSITGTGLGLAIAKQLVDAMGGEMTVTSRHGEGSTFSFWVPQKLMDHAPLAQVEGAPGLRVLVQGRPIFCTHVLALLNALGVAAATEEDGGPLTHCLYDHTVPTTELRRLRSGNPGLAFATLRNMRDALDVADVQDTILFAPLLVTDLARFLNQQPGAAGPQPAPAGETGLPADFVVPAAQLLVVDDNQVNLLVASEMLRAFGAPTVECAGDGPQALEMCAQKSYDIIFLDHMMPEMDGIQVTARLRGEAGPNRQTPIVALTANVMNNMQSYYVRHGMDDFIGKPVEFADMARVLMRWLPPEKLEMAPGGGPAGQPGGAGAEGAHGDALAFDPATLVDALDAYGFYASDTVRELGGSLEGYLARLKSAPAELEDLLTGMATEQTAQQWDALVRSTLELSGLLQGIGARHHATRFGKLAAAARGGSPVFTGAEYTGLTFNMQMLLAKLRVMAAALAPGGSAAGFNNPDYLQLRLTELGRQLSARSLPKALDLLEDLIGHNMDNQLDTILKEIKLNLQRQDFSIALGHNKKAAAAVKALQQAQKA